MTGKNFRFPPAAVKLRAASRPHPHLIPSPTLAKYIGLGHLRGVLPPP